MNYIFSMHSISKQMARLSPFPFAYCAQESRIKTRKNQQKEQAASQGKKEIKPSG